MTEKRVESLEDVEEPEQDILYIIEPGASSWLWNGTSFVQHENRAPSILYNKVFRDIKSEIINDEVIITPP